eukprot:scaffold1117_cov32-Phaeocystis_antarctica.AAC.1
MQLPALAAVRAGSSQLARHRTHHRVPAAVGGGDVGVRRRLKRPAGEPAREIHHRGRRRRHGDRRAGGPSEPRRPSRRLHDLEIERLTRVRPVGDRPRPKALREGSPRREGGLQRVRRGGRLLGMYDAPIRRLGGHAARAAPPPAAQALHAAQAWRSRVFAARLLRLPLLHPSRPIRHRLADSTWRASG